MPWNHLKQLPSLLAQILAVRHGFKTTVLFALDPADCFDLRERKRRK